jgi:uncharacterized delta-60 repeat protein
MREVTESNLHVLFARRGGDVSVPAELPPQVRHRVRVRRAVYAAGASVLLAGVVGGLLAARSLDLADPDRTVVTSDVHLDRSFGDGGVVTTDLGFEREELRDVAIQPDGGVVVVACGITLVRYTRDGSPDATFGDGGIVRTDLGRAGGAGGDCGTGVAIQPDGRIVVAGHAGYGGPTGQGAIVLLRYLPNGSLDSTFGHGGRVVTDVTPASDAASDVELQDDGKIVVAGSAGDFGPNSAAVVARFNRNGTLDASFGDGGYATTQFTPAVDTAADVSVQPDGKIVVAGSAGGSSLWNRDGRAIVVARFLASGNLDAGFGTAGMAIADVAPDDVSVSGMTLQPDGGIVVVGDGPRGSVVVRYLDDGRPDGGFGIGGIVRADAASAGYLGGVAALPDGDVLVAGQAGHVCVLSRYEGNGDADLSFGSAGRIETETPRGTDCGAIALGVDGSVVVAGTAAYLGDRDALFVVMFRSAGERV